MNVERLTKRILGGIDVMGAFISESSRSWVRKMAERLAAYEDTGMEPEEIVALAKGTLKSATVDVGTKLYDLAASNVFEKRYGITLDRMCELAEADRDGRRVELPCKTGDICYEIDPGHPGIIKHTVIGTTVYNRQADGKRYMTDFVNVITIDTQAVAEDGCEWADQYTAEEWADAPKTRESAEAALKAGDPR